MTFDRFDMATFDGCATNRERAAWLLRASLDTLQREEMAIRHYLRESGFREGLAYLDAELRSLRAERREDGHVVDVITLAVARGRMARVAEGLPPVGMGGNP